MKIRIAGVPNPRTRVPEADSPKNAPDITEQAIRTFVKARLARLVPSLSKAFLVEEMEVCSGRARIDLAVIGDRLIGIEIKGPQDSVTRLPGQANAYSQCFDHVVLIVHESLATKARALIPDWWGLIAGRQVDGRIRYRFERRPDTNPSLNLEKVLSLLWREEIDALLADLLGSHPKPRATKKSIRAELLAQVEPPVLHQASLRKLRERTEWRGVPI
ncbi:MAG: sce7726 family protein [Vicinamibacterales bacterium]